MLDGDVDISKISLQWIAAIDRIRPRSVKDQIDRPDRLVHGVDNGEAHLRQIIGYIRTTALNPSQNLPPASIT